MNILILMLVIILYVLIQINVFDFEYYQRALHKFGLSLTMTHQITMYIQIKWAYELHPNSQLHEADFTLACVKVFYDYHHLQQTSNFKVTSYNQARWQLSTIIRLLAREKASINN